MSHQLSDWRAGGVSLPVDAAARLAILALSVASRPNFSSRGWPSWPKLVLQFDASEVSSYRSRATCTAVNEGEAIQFYRPTGLRRQPARYAARRSDRPPARTCSR